MNLFGIVAYAESAAVAISSPPGEISPIMSVLPFLPLILFVFVVLFIPSFIAYKRNHIQKTAILLLNIFLGWTFIGWVVALIWATLKDKSKPVNKIE